MSVEVPREFSGYACRVIVIPIEEAMQQLREGEETRNLMRVGLMKSEIRLPENFEQEFEGLDGQVAALFEGAGREIPS